MHRFLTTAARREIVWRALRTAMLIGCLLAVINHGPELLTGHISARRLLQIFLTYLVPYCVSTYAATMQELRHENESNIRPVTALGLESSEGSVAQTSKQCHG